MDKLSKLRAELLATYGGFSHRYIAKLVLCGGKEDPSEKEVRLVSRHLRKVQLSVRAYRSGETGPARRHVQSILTTHRRRKSA